ncbi:hypothetical protein G5714_004201 [Onychostoma macrolepis]|uniref:Uncharacterized protein n=1 Tax=Onychostoma macrolepis TaxID=369639 RepID=A0A7J6DBS3_9TELE|nr:hypothetical protein G5714_004201 [Onychostoma macrolepis]
MVKKIRAELGRECKYVRPADTSAKGKYAQCGKYALGFKDKPGHRLPKAGVYAEAGVGRAAAEISVLEAEAKGPNASAGVGASVTGAGVMARAEVASVSAKAGPVAAKLGLGVDTVKSPGEVISRYNQVLKTFRKVRTMSEAFHRHSVDRGTIAATAPIAELQIADPKTYSTLVFNPAMERLLAFAKRCASSVNPEIKRFIEDLKARGHLLPILMKY